MEPDREYPSFAVYAATRGALMRRAQEAIGKAVADGYAHAEIGSVTVDEYGDAWRADIWLDGFPF